MQEKTIRRITGVVSNYHLKYQDVSIPTIMNKCATIPGLATLLSRSIKDDNQKIEFALGVKFMDTNKVWTDHLDNDASPFHRYLKLLTTDCPKLKLLDNILDEQLVRKDFLGRPSKGIIFTRFQRDGPRRYLKDIYGPARKHGVRATVVYGSMPKHERQKAADDFQNGDEINLIVGVAEVLGTGLTLTRSQFVVLMEQTGDPGIHSQMIGRCLRQTNWNWDGLNVFELYCDNYAPDKGIYLRRQGRGQFANQLDSNIEAMLSTYSDDSKATDLTQED
ncbi:hypothetical protein A1O1_04570 [Capronia coronata CBS 617.96]|uniref:Helicase C-terminal domain-containing protein n=1 Tax=Capronia coronata CBS 617.96 TaxID=1182541 RepID=W9YEE8_9EURO|nr:uncharacterized protein A1O1_04570 [Capronia coronata CBS 617.96]EXJ87646.1 hypothetical protein A1O1_04570 [Capronia coronata CBS 617.96]